MTENATGLPLRSAPPLPRGPLSRIQRVLEAPWFRRTLWALMAVYLLLILTGIGYALGWW